MHQKPSFSTWSTPALVMRQRAGGGRVGGLVFDDPAGVGEVMEFGQNFIEAEMEAIGAEAELDDLQADRIRVGVFSGAQDAGANQGAAFGG